MWILESWYHIEAIMRCIKYDNTEGLGVECTAATGGFCLINLNKYTHNFPAGM